MLVLPKDFPESIIGTPANVSMDIAPIAIAGLSGNPIFGKEDRQLPMTEPIELSEVMEGTTFYYLQSFRSYVCMLPEITIPEGCFGVLYPRSTLLRMGVMMAPSAIWDPGYVGNGMAVIMPSMPITIEDGVELFSLMIFKGADGAELYSGQYQHEGDKSDEALDGLAGKLTVPEGGEEVK